MLISLRKGVYTLAAFAWLAGSAVAEVHEVLIVEGAYFPPLVHAQIGDSVLFINETGGVHVVQATDESWTSGPISVDGTFSLLLMQETQLAYNASVETEGDGDGQGDETLEQNGEISYDPPPVDEIDDADDS